MIDKEPRDEELRMLSEIFIRAAKDPAFRRELFNEPEKVLAEYNLSSNAKRSILDALRASL